MDAGYETVYTGYFTVNAAPANNPPYVEFQIPPADHCPEKTAYNNRVVLLLEESTIGSESGPCPTGTDSDCIAYTPIYITLITDCIPGAFIMPPASSFDFTAKIGQTS